MYGGTKEEMERLLADAERLSGIHYDLSSYGDIVEAIHVIQGEMEISGRTAEEAAEIYKNTGREVKEQLGTTAQEAATTIEGSVASMKAAWSNLSVGFADENANLTELMSELGDSIVTVLSNGVPRVGQILEGIVLSIPEMIGTAADQLMNAADAIFHNPEAISKAIQAGADFLVNFLDGISKNNEKLLEASLILIGTLAEALIQNIPEIIKAGEEIASAYIDSIIFIFETTSATIGHSIAGLLMMFTEGVNQISGVIAGLGEKIANTISEKLEDANQATKNFLSSLFQSFGESTQGFQEVGVKIVTAINNGIESGSQFIESGSQLIENLTTGMQSKFDTAASVVSEVVSNIINNITGAVGKMKDLGVRYITSFVDGLRNVFSRVLSTAYDITSTVVDGVRLGVGRVRDIGIQLVTGLIDGIKEKISELFEAAKEIIGNILEGIRQGVKDLVQAGKDLIEGLWQGIKEGGKSLIEKVKSLLDDVVNAAKDTLGIHSPSKVFADIGENMAAGLMQGWNTGSKSVMKGVNSSIDSIQREIDFLENRVDTEPDNKGLTNALINLRERKAEVERYQKEAREKKRMNKELKRKKKENKRNYSLHRVESEQTRLFPILKKYH